MEMGRRKKSRKGESSSSRNAKNASFYGDFMYTYMYQKYETQSYIIF